MNAAIHVLIAECTRRDIHLEAAGDRLRWQAPKGALTPDLADQLKTYKPALLEALQARWNPEMAEQGYVWCYDCIYWQPGQSEREGQSHVCTHLDNPYRAQEPRCPRYCKWYEADAD